jgi:hypothetical protein
VRTDALCLEKLKIDENLQIAGTGVEAVSVPDGCRGGLGLLWSSTSGSGATHLYSHSYHACTSIRLSPCVNCSCPEMKCLVFICPSDSLGCCAGQSMRHPGSFPPLRRVQRLHLHTSLPNAKPNPPCLELTDPNDM